MKDLINKIAVRNTMKIKLAEALKMNGYRDEVINQLVNMLNPYRLETMVAIEGVKSVNIDLVQGQRANQANKDIIQTSPLNNTLATNDSFLAFGAQVYLANLDANSNSKLYTYPNPLFFPKSTDDGNEDYGWNNVYGGTVSITSNNKTPIQKVPLREAYYIPQTQQLNAASGTAPNFTRTNRDEIDATFDGYCDFGGIVLLTGDSTAQMNLEFPAVLPTLATLNAGLFISLVGYIIRGQKILI